MYIHELSIEIQKAADLEAIAEEMDMLTGFLRSSGLTQGKEPVTFLQADRMLAVVHCMEEDSLDARYFNKYVQRSVEKLEELCGSQLVSRVIGISSPNYPGPCKCSTRSHFVLFTHYISLGSPLICGACDRCVPLYKIPAYDVDGSNYKVMSWMSNYQACDTLQMNCEVGERWGLKQMEDVKSELSVQGRKICARIEELTGTPTYYFLFNYREISLALDRRRPCPNCRGPWRLETSLHGQYEFMCVPCRLISMETCNGR